MVTERVPQHDVGVAGLKNVEEHQKNNFSIDIPDIAKLEFASNGTYGAKTGFILLTSSLFLIHAFFILKVSLVESILSMCFTALLFLILWKFGCDDNTISD